MLWCLCGPAGGSDEIWCAPWAHYGLHVARALFDIISCQEREINFLCEERRVWPIFFIEFLRRSAILNASERLFMQISPPYF